MLAHVPGASVVLFHVSNQIFALRDGCLRTGESLVGGTLAGYALTCTGSGWTYDVRTGDLHGVTGLRLVTFDVEVRGERVYIAERA